MTTPPIPPLPDPQAGRPFTALAAPGAPLPPFPRDAVGPAVEAQSATQDVVAAGKPSPCPPPTAAARMPVSVYASASVALPSSGAPDAPTHAESPASTPSASAPGEPPASTPAPPPRPSRPARARASARLGVASLALGVIALAVVCLVTLGFAAWPVGVAGLVLGVLALVRREKLRGIAVGGVLASAAALTVAAVLGIVFAVGAVATLSGGAAAPIEQAPAPEVSETVPATFGQTVTYDDGLQLAVSAPEQFEPGPDARGADQAGNVLVTVTLYNGTAAEVPVRVSSTAASGGTTAAPIVDPSQQLSGVPPVSTLAPGQTISYTEGYSVADPDEVAVIVSPAAEYLPSRFSG